MLKVTSQGLGPVRDSDGTGTGTGKAQGRSSLALERITDDPICRAWSFNPVQSSMKIFELLVRGRRRLRVCLPVQVAKPFQVASRHSHGPVAPGNWNGS